MNVQIIQCLIIIISLFSEPSNAEMSYVQKNLIPLFSTYRVIYGDNLYRIGTKFGVEPDVLRKINGIDKPNELKTHQLLIIPRRSGVEIYAAAARNISKKPAPNRYDNIPAWKDIKKLLKPKLIYSLTDIDTGLSLKVVHQCGTLHSDVEPETPRDTDTLKAIYGGQWSWNRRSVIAEINGVKFPASINGMPHGSSSISSNGFPGVFCVHFAGSRIHASGKVDPDHEKMIIKAYKHLNQTTF